MALHTSYQTSDTTIRQSVLYQLSFLYWSGIQQTSIRRPKNWPLWPVNPWPESPGLQGPKYAPGNWLQGSYYWKKSHSAGHYLWPVPYQECQDLQKDTRQDLFSSLTQNLPGQKEQRVEWWPVGQGLTHCSRKYVSTFQLVPVIIIYLYDMCKLYVVESRIPGVII